jgi:UDP-N-acetylmuramoylalanine--D-glutamate ligase
MNLKELKDKKIIILGIGKEGLETLNFLRESFPKKEIGLADKLNFEKLNKKAQKIINSDHKIKRYLGKNYLNNLQNYDVIFKTPGIPFNTIKSFINKDQIVTSQTKFFFDNCPGKIIGITGTKGKSTTASLIYKILQDNKINSSLVGNIGNPSLSYLNKKKDFYVYELSCHQLSDLEKSPHIAIFLNVYPEHLDYYDSFEKYKESKANITKHQKEEDFLIYNSESKDINQIAQKSKAQKIKINSIELKNNFPEALHPLTIKSAILVGKLLEIPENKIIESIKSFQTLPHRLEKVGKYKGITFYNDSLSTIPEATIIALKKLQDVETILLGGFDRGLNFKKLAKEITQSKIKNIIFFPTTGKKIWKELKEITKTDKYNIVFVDNMKDAVQKCFELTQKNKTCLLSNASPSFGLFKDYKERGDLFKKYIKKNG